MDSYKGQALFRNSYQRGLMTILFAGGSKPLMLWDTQTVNGCIRRFLDPELKAMVLLIRGNNVSTTYITCPKNNKDTLGIYFPFFVMIVKNLKKYFNFELTIVDDTGTKRRFRVANFQSSTQISPLCTAMPIGLSNGWNQIQFNLSDFTYRAYKTHFAEVSRVKINANIMIRRIYFAERLLSDDELPDDYKLFLPLSSKKKPTKWIPATADKENVQKVSQTDTQMKTGAKEARKLSLQQQDKSKISLRSKQSIVASTKQSVEKNAHIGKEKDVSDEEKESGEEVDQIKKDQEGVKKLMQHMALDSDGETVGGVHIGLGVQSNKAAEGVDEFGEPIGSSENMDIGAIKLQGMGRELTEKDFRPDDLN